MINRLFNNFNKYKSKNYYCPPYDTKNIDDLKFDKNITFDKEFENQKKENNLYLNEEKEQVKENSHKRDTQDNIEILGFKLNLDDIILIAIIIFLFFQNKKDYILIILLCFMLFDISLDNILDESKNLDFLKNIKF